MERNHLAGYANKVLLLGVLQTPGQVFVFGDGDCGQLGLGEDVTERLRPWPIAVEGKQVGLSRQTQQQ